MAFQLLSRCSLRPSATGTAAFRPAAPMLDAGLVRQQQRAMCSADQEYAWTEESVEDYWKRRWRKVKRKRVRMHHQIDAAHGSTEAFYGLARERLVAQGKLTEEDAKRFTRIDKRLAHLQRHPHLLEFYDWKKQFHDEWIQKHFKQKRGI
mmetsp:Transcript_94206/g.304888  ORF Transcript_94206/g.304888 Transcript_94206/m.304888 type:complete len:150 (-) Transcript_94206:141-590(-)